MEVWNMLKNSLIGAILILLLKLSLYSAHQEWEKTQVVINKGGFQPSIIFNKKNIYMVYVKYVFNNSEIYFIRSANDGKTWTKEKRITTADGHSESPSIIYVNNKIYIFWVDFRNGNNDIFFTYSLDPDGNNFSDNVNVVSNPGDSINPMLSTIEDDINLIWSDDDMGDYELYSKNYNIDDNKWSDKVSITKYSGGSFYASSFSLLDEIHLCWQQRDGDNWKTMYSRSANGTTWTKPLNISEGLNNAYTPFITISEEGIVAAFQGYKDMKSDIYLSILNSLDEQWSIPALVTADLHIERRPIIINTSEGLNFFWMSLSDDKNSVFYSRSIDNGLTLHDPINLSSSCGKVKNFKAVYNAFNDNIYVIWEEKNKGKIYIRKKDKSCPIPIIVKSSHKETKWSINKDISFKWSTGKDLSGIKDFAYILDHNPDTVPELFLLDYPVNEVNFYDVKDGIWYFHLRARDNFNNTGKTIHYKVMVNSELYAANEKYHVIKYKDTLWDIAKKYYKNPDAYKKLSKYNNIDDPNLIYPHQIIKIPSKDYIKSND